MYVRMMDHRRAPGVEHGGDTDAGTEVFGIGRDRENGLARGLEQQIVDHRLILIGELSDRRREREDHVEVGHRQELGLALGEPPLCRRALAFWAMAIATGIVGDGRVSAVLAARDMAAERRRPTALDRRHHLELAEAHMAGVGVTPRQSEVAEDIRYFESGTDHECRFIPAAQDFCLPPAGDDRAGS
jgi:hypothetical protein